MKKILFIFMLVGILPAHAAGDIALKQTVSVDQDAITLNDLLETGIPKGDIAVFAAPAPGEQGVIQISRIREAAQAYGVTLLEGTDRHEISVARNARSISADNIKDIITIGAARKYRADAENIDFLFDRPLAALNVETNIQGALQLSQLRIEPLSGRFEARLIVPGSKSYGEASPFVVTGQAIEMVEVLKLGRSISRGDVMVQGDVTTERMRRQQINGDVLRDPESIIGLSARRALSEDTILRESDLEKPKVIARNESVLIVYETPNIFVTVRGKAIEGGARGDVIEVQNSQSKKSVQATISGPGRVTVSAAPMRRVADLSSVQN